MNAAGTAQSFLDRYDGLQARLPGDARARQEAADVLAARGLPSVREEAWRYTSLRDLAETQFHEALTEVGDHRPAPALPDLGPLAAHSRLVFVDGRLDRALSIGSDLLPIRGFAQSAEFGRMTDPARDRMVALNTMLAEDGADVSVAPGVDAGTLLLVSIGGDLHGTPTAFHPRHRIRLGAGARLAIVEIAVGRGTYLHNPVSEITVGANAALIHVKLQDDSPAAYHLSTTYVDVAADARYEGFTLAMGARLARSEIHARLSGALGHLSLNAAQMLRGSQHGDITTIVSHDQPGGASRQTVRHVLADRARGVFQGKIEVARAAQKTDGYQMNQALLLSDGAEIDCKPQLEIFADDVKCSHGATAGALDPDQLFYLASRGIPADEARAILVRAFLAETLDLVTHDGARALLDGAIARWWRAP